MRKIYSNSTVEISPTFRWVLCAATLIAFSVCRLNAQVFSTYNFSQMTAIFSSIQGAGGTVTTNTGADDVQYGGLSIGFPFVYNGNSYNTFMYSSNGYMQLGANTASGYVPLASFGNVISGMGGDLLGLATNASAMMYRTSGSAPNRRLTLEWKNWGFNNAGATSADFDLQIVLYEADNSIDIIYQPLLSNTETTVTSPAGVVQVGLTGTTSADFSSRTTGSDWSTTIPAISVAPGVAEMTYNQTVRPIGGLLFSWTPGNCVSPITQPTSLNINGIGDTYATVNFAAAPGSDSYLVVVCALPTTPFAPVNGSPYSGPGISATTLTNSFTIMGLSPSTSYQAYVYSQNSVCPGGPSYQSLFPLTGLFTTTIPMVTNTWLGINPGPDNWQNPANWSGGVPNASTDVTIPPLTVVAYPPNISTAGAVQSLTFQSSSFINVAVGASLNIKGNIASGNGAVKGLGTAVISGAAGQTITGNLTLNNVNFTNASGLGVTIAATSSVRIEPSASTGSGIVLFGNSAKFTNNGSFTLVSNAIGTARIGPIPTVAPNAATISGNMTVERYLPNQGSGTGSWYFMGSPVSGQGFNDFADDFSVSGPVPGFGEQGGNIHVTSTERSTIFKYVEPSHNVHLDTVQKNGWRIPPNENVKPGVGYRVWVNYQSNSSHKFSNTGPISIGDNIDGSFELDTLDRSEYAPCFPTSPTHNPQDCNESNRGWNLLSNPFPCDIDWDLPGWSKPSPSIMNNAFVTWNSALNGYRVYVGSGGVSLGVTASAVPNPNLIASGQGFFVRRISLVKAVGKIAVKETGKTTGTSATYHRPAVVAVNQMTIGLTRLEDGDDYRFVSMFRIREDASESFDNEFDFYGLTGSRPHIAFPIGGDRLVLNTLGPVTLTTHVPMEFQYGGQQGTFKLSFADGSSFQNVAVYLRDRYLNVITETTGSPYTFNVDGTAESQATDRFELLVNPGVVLVTPSSSSKSGLSVYPNPSLAGKGNTFTLNGFDAKKANLAIADAMGKIVFNAAIDLAKEGLTEYHMTENLPAGIYTVKATGGSKSFALKMAVR